jgi:hypothetical protein
MEGRDAGRGGRLTVLPRTPRRFNLPVNLIFAWAFFNKRGQLDEGFAPAVEEFGQPAPPDSKGDSTDMR